MDIAIEDSQWQVCECLDLDISLTPDLEEWESAEAFRRHIRSEEFRRVLVAVDMCCEEPQIVIGNLSGHSGMEYLRKLRDEGDKIRIA